MSNRPSRLRLRWQDADALISAVHSQSPVGGLTHDYYKYPARFSPEFAGAAIDVFTDPGDLVVDPFVGGGTTLVESRASGRLSIGTDISTLATFVSRAKTRVFAGADLDYLHSWLDALPDKINLHRKSSSGHWDDIGYTRNLDCEQTWPIRKAIELALSEVERIRSKKRQDFARCVVLRTAQWALDGRKEIPSAEQFREKLRSFADSLLQGAEEFSTAARRADRLATAYRKRSVSLNTKAEGLANYIEHMDRGSPKLVVTSPPYPGVHVLYHRWQVRGGRETPAPFWIADQLDGAGEAYYLMHARRSELNRYSDGIHAAFSSLSRVSNRGTVVIQLVAFSDPQQHLPRYLDVLHRSGLKEYVLSDFVDSSDGRLWRNIPGRKWHANRKGDLESGKEVVLIHKVR